MDCWCYFDYIYFNFVKYGLVMVVKDWFFFIFYWVVVDGFYFEDWVGDFFLEVWVVEWV